jgi:hypothetical protein
MEMIEITTSSSISVKALIAEVGWGVEDLESSGGRGEKSEIRRPKSEGKPKAEIRKDVALPLLLACARVRPSGFGFLSGFGLRISNFRPDPSLEPARPSPSLCGRLLISP